MKKLSIYNQYIEDGKRTIIYNNKLGNVIEVNTKDIREAKHFLIESADPQLYRLGFIVNEDEISESRKFYNEINSKSQILDVMLIMTYNCNAKCAYCFESQEIMKNNKNINEVESVCDFIVDKFNKGNYKTLKLNFFGGEPSLEWEKICQVLKKIRECKIPHKSIMITNGTLLNEKMILELIENGLTNYQITLDGPKEIHDFRRPLKNNESSWDKIINSIKLLCKHNASISLRTIIDEVNINFLEDLITEIPKEFFNSNNVISIAPVIGVLKENTITTLNNRANNVIRAWEVIDDKKLPIQKILPVYAPCPFHANDCAFYIDLAGNIYSCGGYVGDIAEIEANYNKKNQNYYERQSYKPPEKCFSCAFFYQCMGSCTYEKKSINADCQYIYLKKVYDAYYSKIK